MLLDAGHRAVPQAGRIAVALHDVEAASFERCALIRDWLADAGIDRVTLLVIPASDLHPFHDRRPELAEWLTERVRAGDTVAQHGFQHRRAHGGAGGWPVRRHGDPAAEFAGLDEAEARRAVDAGRRVLRLAGIQTRGFVAPAYAYTEALQRVLAARFEWWASGEELHTDHGRSGFRAPVHAVERSASLRCFGGVAALRARAASAGELLRLDLHPAALAHPGHVGAVEALLRRARHRQAVTYDELALA